MIPTDIVAERRSAAVTHPIEIGNTSESARRVGASRQSVYSCKLLEANKDLCAGSQDQTCPPDAQRHFIVWIEQL